MGGGHTKITEIYLFPMREQLILKFPFGRADGTATAALCNVQRAQPRHAARSSRQPPSRRSEAATAAPAASFPPCVAAWMMMWGCVCVWPWPWWWDTEGYNLQVEQGSKFQIGLFKKFKFFSISGP